VAARVRGMAPCGRDKVGGPTSKVWRLPGAGPASDTRSKHLSCQRVLNGVFSPLRAGWGLGFLTEQGQIPADHCGQRAGGAVGGRGPSPFARRPAGRRGMRRGMHLARQFAPADRGGGLRLSGGIRERSRCRLCCGLALVRRLATGRVGTRAV
jgi:hypothetical protein